MSKGKKLTGCQCTCKDMKNLANHNASDTVDSNTQLSMHLQRYEKFS